MRKQNKYVELFNFNNTNGNIKQKSVRGGFNMMGSEVINLGLRIGSTIVLARLLMPEHFGLIGMVTALTSFAERFKDLGLSTATVQQKKINHEQVSNLFWINAGIGLLIMLVVAALSGLISKFYADRRLVGVTLAISSGFLFGGLTIQHQALLRRQMRYFAIAKVTILANLFSIMFAIVLAWKGYEYWALVGKELSRLALLFLGMWYSCRWWPGLPTRGSGIGSMLRFGRDVTGFDVVYFFSRNIDQILIGKYWGAVALGFYKQAYQLIAMPISQIQFPLDYVAIPTLSTVQNDFEKFRRYYTKIISALSFVYMPIVVYLAIFSNSIIHLLLGERWMQSADIFRVLAIALFIQPVANTAGTVMVTFGKTRRYFYWGVLNAVWLIMAFCIGNFWGPIGIAYAFAIGTYLTVLPSLLYGFYDTPISILLFIKAISLPILSSGLMGIMLIVAQKYFITLNTLFDMIITLGIAAILYLVVFILLPNGRNKIKEYYNDSLSMFDSSGSK